MIDPQFVEGVRTAIALLAAEQVAAEAKAAEFRSAGSLMLDADRAKHEHFAAWAEGHARAFEIARGPLVGLLGEIESGIDDGFLAIARGTFDKSKQLSLPIPGSDATPTGEKDKRHG
jgi:hypothetical protein